MTKIEEKALDAYPTYTAENIDDVIKARKLFIKGYYQALEDVKKEIDCKVKGIIPAIQTYTDFAISELKGLQNFIDNLKK